jgi:hypothetical protein
VRVLHTCFRSQMLFSRFSLISDVVSCHLLQGIFTVEADLNTRLPTPTAHPASHFLTFKVSRRLCQCPLVDRDPQVALTVHHHRLIPTHAHQAPYLG